MPLPLRLIEIIIPTATADALDQLPSGSEVLGRWVDRIGNDLTLVRMLVDAEHTEGMLDDLQNRFAKIDGFRVILLPVQATLPRPEEDQVEATVTEKSPERISREEIYNEVSRGANVSRVFIVQVVLATMVAAVGLIRNDTAVLIGAMVIAPLLGPNMSLCLATTLGDFKLVLKSLKANLVGLTVALVTSLLIGLLFPVDPESAGIKARTLVSGGDIILALAAGCAGVLAFTTGAPTALIGVMVAVALVPPFTVFGVLLAEGEFHAASGALLLVATNLICVNLAGVLTFAVQGLRPRNWWEADRAQRATRYAVATWSLLLAILLALIFVATRG